MEERDKQLIERWIKEDQELKQCFEEHQTLEKKLEQMQSRPYLSTEDEIEIKKIKKLKLAEKDRMEMILARYRTKA